MTIQQISIKTTPLKLFDLVFSREGPALFRDAKTYSSYERGYDTMRASWMMIPSVTIDLAYRKPCAIHFNIKRRGIMHIHGTMMLTRHTAFFTYNIDTWVPLYKRIIQRKMQRAIQDIGSVTC
jgi:hypothetical protein